MLAADTYLKRNVLGMVFGLLLWKLGLAHRGRCGARMGFRLWVFHAQSRSSAQSLRRLDRL